jgi:hypothetical protein
MQESLSLSVTLGGLAPLSCLPLHRTNYSTAYNDKTTATCTPLLSTSLLQPLQSIDVDTTLLSQSSDAKSQTSLTQRALDTTNTNDTSPTRSTNTVNVNRGL